MARLERAAVNLYLLPGHEEYARFVIIARSRTGSNMLVSYLSSHPNTNVSGEVFARIRGKSEASTWRNIFCRHRPDIAAVGFKIFYYHPLDSSSRLVWKWIEGDTRMRVIHLTRNNILRTLLSRKISELTDIWSLDVGATSKVESVGKVCTHAKRVHRRV